MGKIISLFKYYWKLNFSKLHKIDKEILIEQNCFLAHCFVINNTKGNLYERIDYAIKMRDSYEICTSTIRKGDVSPNNYYADIGIILNKGIVTFCCPGDGNTKRINGKLICNDELGVENPNKSQIENVIINRHNYNELLLINYNPIGIIISNDDFGKAHALYAMNYSIPDFYNNTKQYKLPYYSLTKGNLELIRFDESRNDFRGVKQVSIQELYSKS